MNKKMLIGALAAVLVAVTSYAQPQVGGHDVGGAGESTGIFPGLQRQATASDIDVTLFAARGAVRQSSNGEAWRTDAGATITAIRNGQFTDLGSHLTPEMVSQNFPQLSQKTLWVGAHAKAKSGEKINLDMFSFEIDSSDEGNSLRSRYSTIGGNFIYRPEAVGIIRNSDGTIKEVLTSGDGSIMVDEIIFIGIQSPYYTYQNESQRQGIVDYVLGHNLSLTARVQVVSNGTVIGSASRTFNFTDVASPIISIRKNGNNVVVSYNATPNRSLTLQGRTEAGSGNWVNLTTVNTGSSGVGEITRTPSATGYGFYRAMLQ